MPFQFRKEAIEEDLNTNFPSQGQGNPPLYYSLSEVVVPTYSINSTAEGSGLPQNLQTAWDFSTAEQVVENGSGVVANTPGFYLVEINVSIDTVGANNSPRLEISDGLTAKSIWKISSITSGTSGANSVTNDQLVVFLRSGDTLSAVSNNNSSRIVVNSRQIATVNGQLINPLGFSFA